MLLPLLCHQATSAEPDPIAEKLYQSTVVLTNGYGHGSGVLFTRGDKSFIWTAGHVADIFENSDGTYREVTVEQGDRVGRARVIRGGDCRYGRDLALLEVVQGDFCGDSHFYRAYNQVFVGQQIIHCGTPLDRAWNHRLVFYGRISAVNQWCKAEPGLIETGRFLDCIDITGSGGCSGGPVVNKEDGGILGLLVMGFTNGHRLNIMEPTWAIHDWAAKHDCLWAFDYDVPVPHTITPWLSDGYLRDCAGRQPGSGWGEAPPEPEEEPTPATPAAVLNKRIIELILSLVA